MAVSAVVNVAQSLHTFVGHGAIDYNISMAGRSSARGRLGMLCTPTSGQTTGGCGLVWCGKRASSGHSDRDPCDKRSIILPCLGLMAGR